MQFFPAPVETLIEKFAKLPGIGRKTAQRLAFHMLSLPEEESKAFAEALLSAKTATRFCRQCQNLTTEELCPICASPTRDRATVCVVSDPKDVAAIERTSEYRGQYHVLHGVISPMGHVGPDELRIKELLERVSESAIAEVIMATNPDTEGEATALYIARLLKPFGIRVTRLAYGIPMGGHLEFTDEATLGRAIEGRRDI
ncbi:recombination mediator RecR [Oscillospiraceae bacterium OttesenSCG-928-G22]|nr:recombination mediator RecR [Oscillospiraceae bacterium OttesenSCG-928-G22]